MISIFIDGEAGTTGLQIRDRLRNRPELKLASIDESRRKDAAARRELLNSVDVAILCLPEEAAKDAVAMIDPKSQTRVIDASSAFRVAPDWVYGMPELSRDHVARVAAAGRVSNPGCYPQGLIALIKPLIDAGIVPRDYPVAYHAVSGYSGGGRKMIEDYKAKGQSAAPYLPYGLTFDHKHLPEMKMHAGLWRDPLFEPAVGNYAQGMLGSVPVFLDLLARRVSAADLHHCLGAAYDGAAFIEVAPLAEVERGPDINPQALNNTNRMRLHVFANEARGQAVLTAVYDNLGKGASGAAVQNLNLMIGAAEGLGVDLPLAA
jgi:N-acetyl-gamma-glutamyl-phosphate reductase